MVHFLMPDSYGQSSGTVVHQHVQVPNQLSPHQTVSDSQEEVRAGVVPHSYHTVSCLMDA